MSIAERDVVERTDTPESSDSLLNSSHSLQTIRFVLEELGIKDIREEGVDQFVCESPFPSGGRMAVNSLTGTWRDDALHNGHLDELVYRLKGCATIDEARAFIDDVKARRGQSSKPPSSRRKSRKTFDLRTADSIPPQDTHWLVTHNVGLATVTSIVGNPGRGKSMFTKTLVAAATRGEALPFDTEADITEPVSAVLLMGEDSIKRDAVPQLIEAGADMSRVYFPYCTGDDYESDELPVFPDDIPELEAKIRDANAKGANVKIVVIDPLTVFLSSKINAYNDQELRQVLTPLKQMAERTGAAVIVIGHLNKNSTKPAGYRAGGSIALVAAARTAIMVVEHPQDRSMSVLAVQKSNLSEIPPQVVFSVEKGDSGAARVAFHGTANFDLDTVLQDTEAARKAPTKVEQVEDWLRDVLSEGPRKGKDVGKAAQEQGFSERTLERARKHIHVVTARVSDEDGIYYEWSLPETADADEPDAVPVDAEPSQHEDAPLSLAHAESDATAELDTSLQQTEPLDEPALPSVPSNGDKPAQALPTLDEINLELELLAKDEPDTEVDFIVTDSVAVPDEPPHLAPDDDYWNVVRMHEPEFENPDDLFEEPESEPLYECELCGAPLDYDALLCPSCQRELDAEASEAAD